MFAHSFLEAQRELAKAAADVDRHINITPLRLGEDRVVPAAQLVREERYSRAFDHWHELHPVPKPHRLGG